MKLKKILLGCLATFIEIVTVFLIPFPILFFSLLHAIAFNKKLKKIFKQQIENSALLWVKINHFIWHKILNLNIKITGAENIDLQKNYLIIANHQSWIDILMIEEALAKKTGFSRYFIKKNLIWIPLAGWSCRVLHYPYMYRFNKEYLAKNPHLRQKDILTTQKACRKLKGIHFKLNNFPEGTRFTQEKYKAQQSPYRFLLKPKTAGIAYALEILNDQIDTILDLTITFSKKPCITDLFFGDLGEINIHMEKIPITPDLIGDYSSDAAYKVHIQEFLTKRWQKKDALIAQMNDYRVNQKKS